MSKDCLGLVLVWTRTRGSLWPLIIIFGVTLSLLKQYLKFGRYVLIECLRSDSGIQVQFPDKEEVLHLVDAIRKKYPLLCKEQVFGTMDRLKLYLQQSSDHVIQNVFYNSWKHDHYFTNIFLFTPDSMIRAMVINMPGTTHDSTATEYGFIYKKLA
eukprot:7628499-Ditylum_brightwellii.AAC.1